MKLDESALIQAKTDLCEEALYLLELAYDSHQRKFEVLPEINNFKTKSKNSLFVSIEGINCAGKTTQVELLREVLSGYDVRVAPRFYNCVPARIVSKNSRGNFYEMFSPITDSLLIASAYVEKMHRLGRLQCDLILGDRSADSLYVFQGRKLITSKLSLQQTLGWLMQTVKSVDYDNLRFYLDINLQQVYQRSFERYHETGRPSLSSKDMSELEESLRIHHLLHQQSGREYTLIDANQPKKEVSKEIAEKVRSTLLG